MPPPPPRRIAALQQVGKPRINQCSTVASPHRSNTAATQLGWNPPQAYTQQQSANNKVVYDMVQVSNANTHAMATQMAASFAAAATASNAQAMQTVHSMQATHAASSGSLMNQMAESSRQALDQMKNVVSELMRHGMHAQPMCTLPPPPMPPPNWAMSGGSSGSGGQNPTPVQWTQRSENPTANHRSSSLPPPLRGAARRQAGVRVGRRALAAEQDDAGDAADRARAIRAPFGRRAGEESIRSVRSPLSSQSSSPPRDGVAARAASGGTEARATRKNTKTAREKSDAVMTTSEATAPAPEIGARPPP